MTLIPLKTGDIVVCGSVKCVVNRVQLTQDGPIVEVSPISAERAIVHASEVTLADTSEVARRAKSIGLSQIVSPNEPAAATVAESISIPANMTSKEASDLLSKWSETKTRAKFHVQHTDSPARNDNFVNARGTAKPDPFLNPAPTQRRLPRRRLSDI